MTDKVKSDELKNVSGGINLPCNPECKGCFDNMVCGACMSCIITKPTDDPFIRKYHCDHNKFNDFTMNITTNEIIEDN